MKPILPDIIGQQLLYYMSNVYGSKNIGLWIHTYIARFSLIIYYHSLIYSLGHGATIVMSYGDVRYHGST